MSAIAGIYQMNKEPVSLEQRSRMMAALHQFPADQIQIWRNDNIFFGCHAQWITPESIGEQLPYYDYERQLAITADAIIDNRKELFDLLHVNQHERKTIPDSKLILLAYYKWKEEMPKYLVGDFAFMIWDGRNKKLFGARDMSGYRTLYYVKTANRFAFCTTIEPLLLLPGVEKILNEQWLAEYLAITGPIDTCDAYDTPYKNIQQVPPAHSILIDNNKIKLTRYATFSFEENLKLKSNDEYVEAFQEVFQRAVSDRLRTHHKVGSQLSGGLDSGAVVSFAAREMKKKNQQLETYSYIPPKDFEDFTPKFLLANETPYIQSTVDYVGAVKPHYLDFDGKNSYKDIDSFLEIMEMPYKFFQNSFWLKGMFEETHKKGIGILLNGDGGNFTVSWGPAAHYYALLLRKLKWFRLKQELTLYSQNVGGTRLRKLKILVRLGFPFLDQIIGKKTQGSLPPLISKEFANSTGIYLKLKEKGIDEPGWICEPSEYRARERILTDIFPWNPGNTLTSKLSLRYRLWKRDPTNDIRVVRFCLSLPKEQFVQNGYDRALIRRATYQLLPDDVRLNQNTRGVQGTDWIHRMIPYWHEFIMELEHLVEDKKALEFFNGEILSKALLKLRDGPNYKCDDDRDYINAMRSLIVYRFLKKTWN